MITPEYMAVGKPGNLNVRAQFGQSNTSSALYLNKSDESVQYAASLVSSKPSEPVSMPYTFWSSSAPSLVYVDQEGNITFKSMPNSDSAITITVESLYDHSPIVKYNVVVEDFAYTYEKVELNYVILSEEKKTCGVTRPTVSTHTKVEIPETANGYTVTEIRNNAFESSTSLKEVSLPKTLTAIRNYAFSGTALESVVIPDAVTTINLAAFIRCASLKTVEFGKSLKTVGNSAFQSCSALQSINLPNSVTSVGTYAFSSCKNASKLSLPNGLTTLQTSVFSGCSGLTSVVLPPSIITIGETAFNGCTSLKTIYMGPKVASIGTNAFNNVGLSELYISAQNVPDVDAKAFNKLPGTLYVQGSDAKNAYSQHTIWGAISSVGHFDHPEDAGITMVVVPVNTLSAPARDGNSGPMRVENYNTTSHIYTNTEGETLSHTATLQPGSAGETVTMPSTFWRSSNSSKVYVDNDGNLTVLKVPEMSSPVTLTAESLYDNGPTHEILVDNYLMTGVEEIIGEDNADATDDASVRIFTINGLPAGNNLNGLAPGIYIVKQGMKIVKITVR